MVKIEYDFKDSYNPATVITNTLIDGTPETVTVDTVIENKRFENLGTVLFLNADGLTITFKNCLFVNCDNIIHSQNFSFVEVNFEKCTIYKCKKIGELNHDTDGGTYFKKCIISETPLLNTNRPVLFVNGEKSIINELFGILSTVIYNDTVVSNPMLLTSDDYKLMSKSRGYDYDSVGAVGVGYTGTWEAPASYTDCGVWNEKRAVKNTVFNTWTVEHIPQLTKGLKYFNKNDFEDYDGIVRSEFEKVIETLTLDFDANGLTEADTLHFLNLVKSVNNEVKIYPDKDVATSYYLARFTRPSETKYKKLNAIFWDTKRDMVKNDLLKGFSLTFDIVEKAGIENV